MLTISSWERWKKKNSWWYSHLHPHWYFNPHLLFLLSKSSGHWFSAEKIIPVIQFLWIDLQSNMARWKSRCSIFLSHFNAHKKLRDFPAMFDDAEEKKHVVSHIVAINSHLYPFYYLRNSVSIMNIPYSPKKKHHVCWINNCFWWLSIVKSSSKHGRNTLTRQPPLLLREHSSPPPVSHCGQLLWMVDGTIGIQ